MKLKIFITNIVVAIVLVVLFNATTSCESKSGKRVRKSQSVSGQTYIMTYKGYVNGRFVKRATTVKATSPIEASQILKEQTFIAFDSIRINSVRLTK